MGVVWWRCACVQSKRFPIEPAVTSTHLAPSSLRSLVACETGLPSNCESPRRLERLQYGKVKWKNDPRFQHFLGLCFWKPRFCYKHAQASNMKRRIRTKAMFSYFVIFSRGMIQYDMHVPLVTASGISSIRPSQVLNSALLGRMKGLGTLAVSPPCWSRDIERRWGKSAVFSHCH